MPDAAGPYLARLDHLRFLAAGLVLMFHQLHAHVGDLRARNPLLSLIDEGHTGIGLFMVISGFVLTVVSGGQPVRWGGFMRNRVLRIYPLFVFAVFLQLMISTYNGHRNWGLLQLLGWLVPFRADTVPLAPHFVQLWTIWVEFQFYLVFPFLLAFARRWGAPYLLGLMLLFLAMRVLVFAAEGSVRYLAYETIFGRMDQFLVGMLLGRAWLARPPVMHPGWAVGAALAVLLGVHAFSRGVGYTAIDSAWWLLWPDVEALLWGALLWAYLGARAPGPVALWAPVSRALAALGRLSFSIYVLHMLVILAVKQRVGLLPWWGGDPIVQALVTGVLVVLPLTLVLATGTWLLIERPFLALRRGYRAPLQADSALEAPSPLRKPNA